MASFKEAYFLFSFVPFFFFCIALIPLFLELKNTDHGYKTITKELTEYSERTI